MPPFKILILYSLTKCTGKLFTHFGLYCNFPFMKLQVQSELYCIAYKTTLFQTCRHNRSRISRGTVQKNSLMPPPRSYVIHTNLFLLVISYIHSSEILLKGLVSEAIGTKPQTFDPYSVLCYYLQKGLWCHLNA